MKHNTLHDIHVKAPSHKLKKLANGHIVQLTHEELQHGPHHLKVHHLTHKKIMESRKKLKGARIALSQPEIHASGSLWDAVKGGLKWLGSQALNGIQSGATAAVPELAPVFDAARNGVKTLTGLGVKKHHKKKHHINHVSSEEMKIRMAKVRAAKKNHKAGSFLLHA